RIQESQGGDRKSNRAAIKRRSEDDKAADHKKQVHAEKAVFGIPEKLGIEVFSGQQLVAVVHDVTDTGCGVVIHQHHHGRNEADEVDQMIALMILHDIHLYSMGAKTICLVALRSYLPLGVRGNSPSTRRRRVGTIYGGKRDFRSLLNVSSE